MKHRFVIDVDPGGDDVLLGGGVNPAEWETPDLLEALARLHRGDRLMAGGAEIADYTRVLTDQDREDLRALRDQLGVTHGKEQTQ